MKQLTLFILMALIFQSVKAQNILTAETVIQSILAVPEMYSYTKARTEAEKMIKQEKNDPMAEPRRMAIREKYIELKAVYDNVFSNIIIDLRDPKALKKLESNPSGYMASFNQMIRATNTKFNEFQQIVMEDKKAIPLALLLPLIETGWNLVKDLIQNRRIKRETWQQLSLSLLPLAEKKLFMPEFETLWPASLSAEPITRKMGSSSLIQSPEPKVFSQPFFESANGDLQIVKVTRTGKIPVTVTAQDKILTTEDSFAPGTEFKLIGKTEALVYVFAKNLNQYQLIYPLNFGNDKGTHNVPSAYELDINQQGQFSIPNESNVFKIDNEAISAEEWIVVYSRALINNFTDLQSLIDDMENSKGTTVSKSSNPTIAADRSTIEMDKISGAIISKMFKIKIKKQL